MKASSAAVATRKTVVRKTPRETLRDLRTRAGVTAAEAARALGYASTNGYIQYEYEKHGDKLIPYKIVKGLLPLLVGRGTPPVTTDELISISEARSLRADTAPTAMTPASVAPVAGQLLPVRYRVEAGVYLEQAVAGTKAYGAAPVAVASDVEAQAQFAAVVADDPRRTVLHCVLPAHVGSALRAGRRAIALRPRGVSDLVEVVSVTLDKDGESPGGERVVGVVIGVYARV